MGCEWSDQVGRLSWVIQEVRQGVGSRPMRGPARQAMKRQEIIKAARGQDAP